MALKAQDLDKVLHHWAPRWGVAHCVSMAVLSCCVLVAFCVVHKELRRQGVEREAAEEVKRV